MTARRDARKLWLLLPLVLVGSPGSAAAEHWSRSPTHVWQDGETIHARASAARERDAVEKARAHLAAALGAQIPDLDGALAARAAVVGDRLDEGDTIHVRLDFPAQYGQACWTAERWLSEAAQAREREDEIAALEGLAHAAWRAPREVAVLDSLGTELADSGRWASAAIVLDAAARSLENLPLSLLRNRATVHIWMHDRGPAAHAVEMLRAYDPADPELQILDAMAQSVRGALLVTEKPVLPVHAQTLDAELMGRFLAWILLDRDERAELLDLDLGDRGRRDEWIADGLRFGPVFGALRTTRELEVTDRDGEPWIVTVAEQPAGSSCLRLAGDVEPPPEVRDGNHPILLGGVYPLTDLDGAARVDEGWMRPIYYSTVKNVPDRLRLVSFLRWGDRTWRVDVDGLIGPEELARPGMFAVPQIVEMLLTGVSPVQGGKE